MAKSIFLLVLTLVTAGCSAPANPVVSSEASPTAIALDAEATTVEATPTQASETSAAKSIATPTPTPTSIPTADPQNLRIRFDGPTETFSLPGERRELPDNILQEIGFFAVGGGGGEYRCDFFEHPVTMMPDGQTVEWMTSVNLIICGFSPDEAITVEIMSPDGQIILQKRVTASYSTIDFHYTPELDAPPGVYTARFSGISGTIEQTFELIVPPGPRAYWHEDRLILFRFEPRETVRLYTFEPASISDSTLSTMMVATGMSSLAAWNEFVVDGGGQLIIEGIPASSFDVVGETSGEVEVLGTEADLKSIASPYSVLVLRPTRDRLLESDNVWTLTLTEFEEPGTQKSEATVAPDDMLYWSIRWCAQTRSSESSGTTDQFLKEALDSIDMAFSINGVEVKSPYLRTSEELHETGSWLCHRWSTLVTNWTTEQPTTLEIKYELSDTVDGGQRTYPPGVYRYIVTVYAEEEAGQ